MLEHVSCTYTTVSLLTYTFSHCLVMSPAPTTPISEGLPTQGLGGMYRPGRCGANFSQPAKGVDVHQGQWTRGDEPNLQLLYLVYWPLRSPGRLLGLWTVYVALSAISLNTHEREFLPCDGSWLQRRHTRKRLLHGTWKAHTSGHRSKLRGLQYRSCMCHHSDRRGR